MQPPIWGIQIRGILVPSFRVACIRSLAGLAVLILLVSMPRGVAAEQRFEPGELLVGFETAADRDKAAKVLAQNALHVRDSNIVVEVQPIADKAVKLKLKLPANVLSASRNNPSEEKAWLEDAAKQIKAADRSVTYAHPNWIAEPDRPLAPTALNKASNGTGQGVRQATPQVTPQATPQVANHSHRAVSRVHSGKRHMRSHVASRLAHRHVCARHPAYRYCHHRHYAHHWSYRGHAGIKHKKSPRAYAHHRVRT
jgi:hypothetical protein